MKSRRGRREPSTASGLLVSAITVVVVLLAGEFITRWRDPTASLWHFPNYVYEATKPAGWEVQLAYDSTLGWEPIPGKVGTLLGKRISFTTLGTREQNTDRTRPTGPLILALGDSVTEGYAVGNDETWPANLERQIDRPVLNAGVRGYGLDQIVLRAGRLIPKLKPATAVLAFIHDDIVRDGLSVREAKGKPYFVPEGDGLALKNVPVQNVRTASTAMNLARSLFGYSHLVDWVMGRLGLQMWWYGWEVPTGADTAVVSCRLMERFAALVRRENVKALVVALPEQWMFTDAGIREKYAKDQAAVLSCAAKAGLPTIDTFGAFEKADAAHNIDTYYVQLHFTDRGAAIAAREIAAALKANGE